MQNILLQSKGDYINGVFVKPQNQPVKKTHSPADLTDNIFSYSTTLDHIEPICEAAQKAYCAWSMLSQNTRNNYLQKLSEVYQQKQKQIAIVISRETGKPLWESHLEAKALSQKIEVTLKKSLPLVQDTSLSLLKLGAKGKIAYRSKGVFLVIGPFNFPVHLPNGHIIAALALGNTVIFKPSEKTPASAQILAECFALAGFPKGVFNLIQGGAKIAQTLIQHKKVDGILFTGSYKVGNTIKAQIHNQPQKILALEMGGKNSCLIWKDADIEKAVYEVLKGVYLTAGQRCSATSRLILHKDIKQKFLEKFINLSKRLKIGHWREHCFMGPLIDKASVDKFTTAYKEAQKQKAHIYLTKKPLDYLKGYYVSPVIVEPISYDPQSFYQNEELFSPFLTVYSVDQPEEAVQLINQGFYGLCVSVFSEEETLVNYFFQNSKVGVFHWNLSTNGASAYLPFGGLGKSGNHQPAGLFSVYTCVTPVAWMQKEACKQEVLWDPTFLHTH